MSENKIIKKVAILGAGLRDKGGGPHLITAARARDGGPRGQPAARGAFAGLAQSQGLPDLTQAVLEGVAYAFADCQRVLKDAGTDFPAALAVGVVVASLAWGQLPVEVYYA